MVVEIVRPGSAASDRAVKPALYAAAGIGCYLRLEAGEQGPAGFAYGLLSGGYVEEARARPGELLRLREPLPCDLDLAALARRM
jgi:hypothetical protein